MPLQPQLVAEVPLNDARASALQFRYLFVTDADGLKTIDVTDPKAPRLVQNNTIRLGDAQRVFVARTYAYVAAGKDGLVIVDVERPEAMREYQRFNAERRAQRRARRDRRDDQRVVVRVRRGRQERPEGAAADVARVAAEVLRLQPGAEAAADRDATRPASRR